MKVLGIFKIALRLRDRHFCETMIGDFESFHYFDFETGFLKKENLLKNGVPFFS